MKRLTTIPNQLSLTNSLASEQWQIRKSSFKKKPISRTDRRTKFIVSVDYSCERASFSSYTTLIVRVDHQPLYVSLIDCRFDMECLFFCNLYLIGNLRRTDRGGKINVDGNSWWRWWMRRSNCFLHGPLKLILDRYVRESLHCELPDPIDEILIDRTVDCRIRFCAYMGNGCFGAIENTSW